MNMELLMSILTAYGATSREGGVRAVIENALRGHVDSLSTDVMGNLIAVKQGDGTGRRIMLSAHMDQIGLMVMDADKQGYLRVHHIGTFSAQRMVNQHVIFENGVAGVVCADADADDKLDVRSLYIDIGADSKEEALSRVPIGEIAVLAPQFARLGEHRIASPALDNRIACCLLTETMTQLPTGMKNDVIAVFSAQEEVGLRGATTAAFHVQPDLGIALDVTGVGDVPGHKDHLPMKLGGGACVKIMDRSLICTPVVVDMMIECAQENGIAFQRELLPMARTEGGAIQRTCAGVPAGVISIPCRYMHSAVETVDLRDVEAAAALLRACICK